MTTHSRQSVHVTDVARTARREAPDFRHGVNACSLRLDSVSKWFHTKQGDTVAVSDVSLSVQPGEFVALLGPSGCGKTTTLRMIAGFETPSDGGIRINEDDIVLVPANRRPVSMVFQSYALFPHLSVRDNIAFGLKLKKMRSSDIRQNVDLVLTTMGLTALADRSPAQLSGGQQQRVALARAMVMRPAVMLFDEPLSNLDAKLRAQMRIEIREVQRRIGITSVFVTHDQHEAMTMADRIAVMNEGRVEQIGTPPELYRRPSSLFVADFLGRANFLDVTVLKRTGSEAVVEALGQRHKVPAHTLAAEGQGTCLLVRPESLQVHSAASRHGHPSGNRAVVLSSVYYGSSIEYELESETGNLVASVADPDPSALFVAGEPVEVGFAPDRSWLLPNTAMEPGHRGMM